MKNLKKLLAVLTAVVLALALVGCGTAPATAPSAAPTTAPTTAPDATADPDAITLTVGASPTPHAQILEAIRPLLAEQGINLVIEEFTDYILPNQALDSGDLGANFFQHQPYLDDFNANNGTELASVVATHFEPLGIYAGRSADLAAIPTGAKIAVPSDTTNEARALQLLAAQGILTLKPDDGLAATVLDIVENPYNVEIIELEAAQVPRSLADVDFAVANGNNALAAGITDKLIASESADSEAAQLYANVLVVRVGDENRPEIKALVDALTSDTARAFIEETFGANVVPVF
jgi:D-methionine transport system substrate-binding protein